MNSIPSRFRVQRKVGTLFFNGNQVGLRQVATATPCQLERRVVPGKQDPTTSAALCLGTAVDDGGARAVEASRPALELSDSPARWRTAPDFSHRVRTSGGGARSPLWVTNVRAWVGGGRRGLWGGAGLSDFACTRHNATFASSGAFVPESTVLPN